MEAITKELAWVFDAQGVHREALAALRLFCEAARQEKLSVEQARQLAGYLYRAQKNPELRFAG